ncbi:MAG TPA: hypothetical protein DCE44_20610 [Verrucomicrobiales bacterium]|nr:hypothetical protein [Verrucomicrobiales bacterium]
MGRLDADPDDHLSPSDQQEGEDYPCDIADEGGRVRSLRYDTYGRLTTATDLGGNVFTSEYDATSGTWKKWGGQWGHPLATSPQNRGGKRGVTGLNGADRAGIVRSMFHFGGSQDRSLNGAESARPLAWSLWAARKLLVKRSAGFFCGPLSRLEDCLFWKIQRPARDGAELNTHTLSHDESSPQAPGPIETSARAQFPDAGDPPARRGH